VLCVVCGSCPMQRQKGHKYCLRAQPDAPAPFRSGC
jgi:hypothetical protein